jgi:hypothetical protein
MMAAAAARAVYAWNTFFLNTTPQQINMYTSSHVVPERSTMKVMGPQYTKALHLGSGSKALGTAPSQSWSLMKGDWTTWRGLPRP